MKPENDGFSGVNDAAAMETISYQMFNPLDFFPPFSNHRLNPFSHPAVGGSKKGDFQRKDRENTLRITANSPLEMVGR